MLRIVAVFATLAVVNGFSVYSLPECLSPIDLNICNQPCNQLCGQPPISVLPAPLGPPQTVCVPAGSAPPGAPNTNAIITLLAALKNAGIIPNPAAPLPPAQDNSNSLLVLKLLDLLKINIGGGAPGNGTAPLLPILGGAGGSPLILIELLNGLLGGGGGAAPPAAAPVPVNVQTLLLSILGALAAPPAASGPCPAGTVPVAMPACAAPVPRCA